LLECEIGLTTHQLFTPATASITIKNQKGAVPNPIHITNGSPETNSYIQIKQSLRNISLICEGTCTREQLQEMITPGLLDLLMEILMVHCRSGSSPDIHIRAEKNILRITLSSIPKNSRHMQLLLECASGLSRELCREPYVPDKKKSKSKNPISSGTQTNYLKHSLYFLIIFSVILILLISLFVYKKKNASAMTESFSGTVILKKIINEDEYYIFVPQKAKISKKDFQVINEGDRVEKSKGQEKIHISKEAPAEKEDFLDLL